MKTLTLIALCTLCSCSIEPTLRVRDYDRHNNRVDQQGNLVPWTNWSIGYRMGTNWVNILNAREESIVLAWGE